MERKSKYDYMPPFNPEDIIYLKISNNLKSVLNFILLHSYENGFFTKTIDEISHYCFNSYSDDRAKKLSIKCLKELVELKVLEKEILPENKRRYKLLDLSHVKKLDGYEKELKDIRAKDKYYKREYIKFKKENAPLFKEDI